MNRYIFKVMPAVCSLFIYIQAVCQDLVLSIPEERSFSDRSSPIIMGAHDDLEDIELASSPGLTVDDLMPFFSKSRNITEKERRANIEEILQRAQTRGSKGNNYLLQLQDMIAQQKRTRSIGLPITLNESHVEPALEWLGKKILKKDVELLNTKFDRQKVITGFSAVGAFVISSGVACLTAYLGSLY